MSETELIVKPSTQAIVEEVEGILGKNVVITNKETCEISAGQVKILRMKYKMLEEERFSATKPIDQTKKRIMDWFRGPLEKIQAAIDKRVGEINAWEREQERLRKVEEARIKKELEEKAAKERAKLEKAAEKAEAKGKDDKAEELRTQAAAVQAPVVEFKQPAKTAGVIVRTDWKYRVIDKTKLPHDYLLVDESKLRKFAIENKEKASLPGVEFYSEESRQIR